MPCASSTTLEFLSMIRACGRRYQPKQRYYFANARAGLEPGSWFLDAAAQSLYVWAPAPDHLPPPPGIGGGGGTSPNQSDEGRGGTAILEARATGTASDERGCFCFNIGFVLPHESFEEAAELAEQRTIEFFNEHLR